MLKLYNTLTRKKEIFKPRRDKRVNLFVCGPTVYDYMHIGHAKTYIQLDAIAKYLKSREYKVFYLQNITDLDDKIIEKARKKKIEPLKLAREFEKYYHQDEKKLGINSVTKHARATDYIKQITKQVKTLINKGYAYKTEDGYYYDIKKFKDYGKLSRRTVLGSEDAVSRIDEGIKKKNRGDFCLWKISKLGEPRWQTELGAGRPGWHIEDTAITETIFGPRYDIHAGAKDLIFPHHEAEIAQMEASSGEKPMVKYWLHTGFLNVKGAKMSKSLKNFITVRQALKKYSPQVLRFFYLNSHYRSPIDFSPEILEKAKNGRQRLQDFIQKIETDGKDDLTLIEKTKEKIVQNLDNDFDTVKAIAVIFNFVKQCHKKNLGGKKTLKFFRELNKIFGIFDFKKTAVPLEIKKLAQQREGFRQQKQWAEADKIRQKINKLGFQIEDTPQGPVIKRLEN